MIINVLVGGHSGIFSKENSINTNAINAIKMSLICRVFGGDANNAITMFVPNAKDIRKIHVHLAMLFHKKRLKKKNTAMFATKLSNMINHFTPVDANSTSAPHAINDSQYFFVKETLSLF